jgi:uncharacterized damage-inducible protein DinB
MTDTRTEPPMAASERDMLEAWLEFHRETLALKCDGLSPEQLTRRAVSPSTLSLLGLVRHMAEVERHWFRRGMAGEDAPPLYYGDENPDGDFDDVDNDSVAIDFATWRAECEQARAIVATLPSLDRFNLVTSRPEPPTARWVLIHMIEEYARHNGHADLLRQCIDGTVGE